MRLHGACIMTDNVSRLVEFYKIVFQTERSGDDVHSSFDDAQLAIYNPGNVNVVKDKNMALMYFVDDVDAEYDRLKTSGLSIEFVSAPAVKPWGVKSFLFKDPDGNEISFLTPVSCLDL